MSIFMGPASCPEKVEPVWCTRGYSDVGPLCIIRKGSELVDLNVFLLIVSSLGLLTRQNKKGKKIEQDCWVLSLLYFSTVEKVNRIKRQYLALLYVNVCWWFLYIMWWMATILTAVEHIKKPSRHLPAQS